MATPLKIHAEIGLAVALAVVLDLVGKSLPLPRLPYGGSIGLRMLPILVVALRHGIKGGIWVGTVYGLVDFVLQGLYFHPVQVILDYPVAHAAIGLAGLFHGGLEGRGNVWYTVRLASGIMLGTLGRFVCHFVSGIVFFGEYAPPDQPLWLYSAFYNASYIIPELILALLLLPVFKRLIRI
jgi:thiamine transporter